MRAIAYVLTLTTTLMPLHGVAQESPEVDTQDFLSQLGREGQNLGIELGSEAKNTPAKVQNGQITVPTKDENGNLQYQGELSSAFKACTQAATLPMPRCRTNISLMA